MLFERLHSVSPASLDIANNGEATLNAVVIIASLLVLAGNDFLFRQLPEGNFEIGRISKPGEPPRFHVKVWERNPKTRRLGLTLEMSFTLDPLTGAELVDAYTELERKRQKILNAGRN